MSLEGRYDPDNVFAKILRGEIPAAKVSEDDEVLVFMDAFPQSEGHTLIIHKTEMARNLLEVSPGPLQRLVAETQRVARAVAEGLKPDGVRIMQFNGEAAGQSVFHLHFHVVPVWADRPMGGHGEGMANPDDLAKTAEVIRAHL